MLTPRGRATDEHERDEASTMRWKALAGIALIVVGAGAVVWAVTGGPGAASTSETQYLTASAQTGDVAATVVATGALERATTYALAFGQAPTAGSSATGSGTWLVRDVAVAPGDTVTKGQKLATADVGSLRSDLVAAQAQLKVAKDQKRLADTQLGDATTTAATRQGRIAVNNAIAQVTNADANVRQIEDQIARATLVAPEDGVVTDVTITRGANAPSGAAVVIATGPLQATADYAEGDLTALKIGQPASVAVDAVGATIKGTVATIAPTASTSAGGSSVVTYVVTVDLVDPPADARAGMTAQVTVTTDQATGVLSVPSSALRGSNGAYTVLVMAPDGTTQSRDVTVGLVTNDGVEVRSGLTEGETVVIGTVASRNQTTTTTTVGGFPGAGGGFRGGEQVIRP
jgi:macrolide-specific efflux system membrane fusion protein